MPTTLYSHRYRDLIRILRKLRQARQFRQADLAKRLGYSQALVSNVERCERRLDVDELLNWLEALGVQPANFFSDLERNRWTSEVDANQKQSRIRKAIPLT